MLTIGEVARFVGVTPRAIRHYHAVGLLDEPVRDRSGYRRYPAAAVTRLVRIKVLAGAGVPLARVGQLLEAGPEEFATATAEIERNLTARIEELEEDRRQVVRLAAGDALVLPPQGVEYLEKLRSLGVPERLVQLEREGWIVIAAHWPDQMEQWLADKIAQLDDPSFARIYRLLLRAYGLGPDDPELARIAAECVGYLREQAAVARVPVVTGDQSGAAQVQLLLEQVTAGAPGWERLIELIERDFHPRERWLYMDWDIPPDGSSNGECDL